MADVARSRIRAAARPVGAYLAKVARFYWFRRQQIARNVRDGGSTSRYEWEIRLSPRDESEAVVWHDSGCNICLPDCCVVCGNEAEGGWLECSFCAIDWRYPLRLPVFGAAFGLVLSLFFGSLWLNVPLGMAAGLLAGYWLKTQQWATIRFRRCENHAETDGVPTVQSDSDSLIIRVGSRRVRRRFRNENREAFRESRHGGSELFTAGNPSSAGLPTRSRSAEEESAPRSIPVVEIVQGSTEIKHDRRPRMKSVDSTHETTEPPDGAGLTS